MKKVVEIYTEYKIPQNLQDHMLRVAAVASLLCDSVNIFVDKSNIVLAELFHDMGNIIKFNWETLLEFREPEGIEYWQKVQKEFIAKYGPDEQKANLAIAAELGLKKEAIALIDKMHFHNNCLNARAKNLDLKIINYADQRVSPHGVVSYNERMEEARVRYRWDEREDREERAKLIACGKEIEKQIFAHCKIKPEDITDEAVAPIIEELKKFVIK